MKVAVAGSSGFIGSALVPLLTENGHDVVRMVRGTARSPGDVSWDPGASIVDLEALSGVDAIVNLAGPGIGDRRWTAARKRYLYDGFVASSRVIARAAAELRTPTLLSVGAMGYYGNDTGGVPLTEDSPAGTDFAARIIVEKEAAAEPAADAGCRVVLPRPSLVMGAGGGTLGRRLLPLAKAGILGPLAGGRTIWSVVSISDTARALAFLLEHEDARGPYNISAPTTTTNGEFTTLLGRAVRRPTVIPVPRFGLQIVLGEFADDVLADFNVDPTKLVDAGFTFEHPDAQSIIDAALA
jgi:hypothetical protein